MDNLKILLSLSMCLHCFEIPALLAEEDQDWDWADYEVQEYKPGAVQTCPKQPPEKYGGLGKRKAVEAPDDCTKVQKCSWKTNSTMVVTATSCFACGEVDGECPNRTLIYRPDGDCYPAHHFTTEEHRCGITDPKDMECDGPEDTEYVHRLAKSRLYLLQNGMDKSKWVNWYGAQEACKALGLKLAKIDNIETDVYLGRELDFFIKDKMWTDNFYWLDGKFDPEQETYVWQDTMEAIQYSNFHYRHPMPKGYGGLFDYKGNYLGSPKEEMCLAQSMPFPFPKKKGETVPYPMHTAWWERKCNSSKKGNILCESTTPGCEVHNSTHTRGWHPRRFNINPLGAYNYADFQPISNRRFVIMRKAHNYEDAKALCERWNLQMYTPRDGDTCLIHDIKSWNPAITAHSFWTDLTYKVKSMAYEYPNGTEVPLHFRNTTILQTRSSGTKSLDETCVSYTWNNEMGLNVNFCKCNFKSLILSPENCKDPIGVVCQHPDADEKPCVDKDNPNDHRYLSFDSKKLGLIRSIYRQPGHGGVCPSGYIRINEDDNYWEPEKGYDFETSSFQYDYLAPYWITKYNSNPPKCILTRASYDPATKKFTRVLREGECNKWLGYVLCKKKDYKFDDEAEHDEAEESYEEDIETVNEYCLECIDGNVLPDYGQIESEEEESTDPPQN